MCIVYISSLEFHLPPLQCNGLATPEYKIYISVFIRIITVEDELMRERKIIVRNVMRLNFNFLHNYLPPNINVREQTHPLLQIVRWCKPGGHNLNNNIFNYNF